MQIDVSKSEWEKLRKLLEVPHEHHDGMNECHICDEPIVTAAVNEITKLRGALSKIPPLLAHAAKQTENDGAAEFYTYSAKSAQRAIFIAQQALAKEETK